MQIPIVQCWSKEGAESLEYHEKSRLKLKAWCCAVAWLMTLLVCHACWFMPLLPCHSCSATLWPPWPTATCCYYWLWLLNAWMQPMLAGFSCNPSFQSLLDLDSLSLLNLFDLLSFFPQPLPILLECGLSDIFWNNSTENRILIKELETLYSYIYVRSPTRARIGITREF